MKMEKILDEEEAIRAFTKLEVHQKSGNVVVLYDWVMDKKGVFGTTTDNKNLFFPFGSIAFAEKKIKSR